MLYASRRSAPLRITTPRYDHTYTHVTRITRTQTHST